MVGHPAAAAAPSPSGPSTVELAESLDAVDAAEWDALSGPDDFFLSYSWLRWVERDRTATARYLLAYAGGRLVGALPVYRLHVARGVFYRSERFAALLGVDGEPLLAGARLGYRSAVLLAAELPAATADRVTGDLLAAALELAAGDGLSHLVLPFLPTAQLDRIGRVRPVLARYDAAEAVAPVGAGIEGYLGLLPPKRRYTARKERSRFAAAGWRTGCEPLASCFEDAARLVALVEQRHGHPVSEPLLRRAFRRQVAVVDADSVVLTCRDDAGELVACSVNYAWKGVLHNHAVGHDHRRLRGAYEYFNLLVYGAVEHAAGHGIDRLHLSLATSAKLQRGAMPRPLWTAVVTCGQSRPRVRLVDPDGMRRGRESLGGFDHAFAPDSWTAPA